MTTILYMLLICVYIVHMYMYMLCVLLCLCYAHSVVFVYVWLRYVVTLRCDVVCLLHCFAHSVVMCLAFSGLLSMDLYNVNTIIQLYKHELYSLPYTLCTYINLYIITHIRCTSLATLTVYVSICVFTLLFQ